MIDPPRSETGGGLESALYIALRVVTAISSIGALILWRLVVFVRDTASLAKEGAGVLAYVASLLWRPSPPLAP